MKQLLLILFLATNICVAQKKIAIVITGYDGMADSIMVSNVNFVDTSYWQVDEKLWYKAKDSGLYEINPWIKSEYELFNVYSCTDFYGTQEGFWFIDQDIILAIARRKLIYLGKM